MKRKKRKGEGKEEKGENWGDKEEEEDIRT